MASGHVNRANRPNTWLLRPTLQVKLLLANPEPSTHGSIADTLVTVAILFFNKTFYFVPMPSMFEPSGAMSIDGPVSRLWRSSSFSCPTSRSKCSMRSRV
jgi:hypothetical protein